MSLQLEIIGGLLIDLFFYRDNFVQYNFVCVERVNLVLVDCNSNLDFIVGRGIWVKF